MMRSKLILLTFIISIIVIGILATIYSFSYSEKTRNEVISISPNIKSIYIIDTNGQINITRSNFSILYLNLNAEGLFASLNSISVSYYTLDNTLYVYVSNPINFFQIYSVNIYVKLHQNSYNNITVNVINGEISLSNIYSKFINLEVNNGLIKINSTFVSKGYLFVSNGEIKIENGEVNFLSALVNNGEIISNFIKTYPKSIYSLTVNNGEIKIYTNTSVNIIPTVNNGEIYLNGKRINTTSGETSFSSTIDAHVNNGEIKIINWN